MNNMKPVAVDEVYRLLNIGATTLVSAGVGADQDIMAAAWACALDYDKGSVVLAKDHYTRKLITQNNLFSLQIPTAKMAALTLSLGSVSKNDDPAKLEKSGAELFCAPEFSSIPLVKGCAAWMIFERLPEPHNEEAYDLFVGRCLAAWSDPSVFKNGHWIFENAADEMRTLHYVAGGHFYQIGKALDV